MNIEISEKPLSWGKLDLSLFGIDKDWYGKTISPALAFGFAADLNHLWFVTAHQKPASLHPEARSGEFKSELWKYDVAEFFLLDSTSGRYLEFNLSPNGAWWSAEFTAPRIRAEAADSPFPGVITYADIDADGSWLSAAAIPLDQLRKRLNFGSESRLNATFILNSPDQQFLSATSLGGGEPNFHLPDQFPKINFFHNPKE